MAIQSQVCTALPARAANHCVPGAGHPRNAHDRVLVAKLILGTQCARPEGG